MPFGAYCSLPCGALVSHDDQEDIEAVNAAPLSPKLARRYVEEGPETEQPKLEGVDAGFDRQESNYTHGVRTTHDPFTPASRALDKLKDGNHRFVEGNVAPRQVPGSAREALATHGQNPMAAVIGCADSRCPAELIFDVKPGDIFVLRNAGNTLTDAEGSFIGSAEYCCGNLGTNLLLVLGHTKCGAIAGATKMVLAAQSKGRKPSKTTLERLLVDLGPVAELAQKELGEDATEAEIAARAVKVNVFYTIDKLLECSAPLREKVREGKLEVHGAIFDINTGKVDFLGQSPRLPALLASKSA